MRRMNLQEATIEELLERYTDIGIQQDLALTDMEIGRFNKLFGQMISIEKELASRGKQARHQLLSLYDHPNAQVRLNAIKETLAVAPKRARKALKELADSVEYPQAGDAGMCLDAFDSGEWKPT